MLEKVLTQLDAWLIRENEARQKDGRRPLQPAIIQVLGQTALIEAKVRLELFATLDVDAVTTAEWVVTQKLDELLRKQGRHLDPHSHEIWMPEGTLYDPLFLGSLVSATIAQADFVLLSKALKAPDKNRNLLTEYLAQGASPRFYELAEKHGLDLEQFL